MFDIGWTELIVVAIVAILVVGPKDLPGMLRSAGRTMGNLRKMARDFQRQFDDALREAELDEVKNLNPAKSFKPLDDARKTMQEYQDEMKQAIGGSDSVNAKEPKTAAADKTSAAAKSEAAVQKSAPAKNKAGTAKKPARRSASKRAEPAKPVKRSTKAAGNATAKARKTPTARPKKGAAS